MSGIAGSDVSVRNEMEQNQAVSNWFISHTTSSPATGQIDDGVIGLAELTRSGVVLDKYHAMLLFRDCITKPTWDDLPAGAMVTGRECIGRMLRDTPVNYTRATTWYQPAYAKWIRYNPDETKVSIRGTKYTTGVLDKRSIGKGATGGLYHVISNEYGSKKALDLMYDMQQVAIGYIYQFGYTVGIMDLLISQETKRKIDLIAADIINKSGLITERLINGEIIPPIGKTVEEFYEEQQLNALKVLDDFNEAILSSINTYTNNLAKLILFGSKGSLTNMYNIMSSIGQKLINGERARKQFGHQRTVCYYPRFDTRPESRGYIINSYLSGMTAAEYFFNAQASRFDFISKALSTSVTGDLNRKAVKNLESIIANNYRMSTKHTAIVQLLYGEDGLDARFIQRVRFPTASMSDADLEREYHYSGSDPVFASEWERVKTDRQQYRDVYMRIEQMTANDLFSDERKAAVDVNDIISGMIAEFEDYVSGGDAATGPLASEPVDDKRLADMTRTVAKYCDDLVYILVNEIQARKRAKVPEHIETAVWLVRMLVRSYLHPAAIKRLRLTPAALGAILDKITLRYQRALVEPGTCVGIIAAQSFSEPLTQYMLDAQHRSATGGTSKSSMTNAKEILGAKATADLESPSMLIPVRPEYQHDKVKVQEIANNIEMMRMNKFVVTWQIFFEKFGEPVHTRYAHERAMIAEFVKRNPLVAPPPDMVRWCIRYQLNKTSLILKNMSLETIVTRLRESYPDAYIVYTPENSPVIIMRVYMRNIMFKTQVSLDTVREINHSLLDTIIRGTDRIINTSVVPIMRNKVEADGSIKRAEMWAIQTTGTNLPEVLMNDHVMPFQVQTDAIQETYEILGIEAARQKIIAELRKLVDNCNHRHYMIYADEMTITGRVTAISVNGMKARDANNVLLRVGFSSPITTIEEAALNAREHPVTGITGPLMLGSVPQIGSLYNGCHVNKEFVRANTKSAAEYLEDL